jgi:hypothetical protein
MKKKVYVTFLILSVEEYLYQSVLRVALPEGILVPKASLVMPRALSLQMRTKN